jgi:arginase
MKDRFFVVPYYMASHRAGVAALARPGWTLLESADTGAPATFMRRVAALHLPTARHVAEVVGAGDRPVIVAGDCVSSLGVLAGLQRAHLAPTLLWLDAHGDFNTWFTTPSGFLGGMPLAMAVGKGEQTILEALQLTPIDPGRIILGDGRDLDAGEWALLAGSGVRHVPDLSTLLEEALPAGPLYVHFDADVLRLEDAPAMNYPAGGGPPLATVRALFQQLADSGQVIAVSVSCWNPELDHDGRSARNVMALLEALLGD